MKILSAVMALSMCAFVGETLSAQEAVPDVFAPGVISGAANDLSPAFTPDGRSVYFTRANSDQSTIVVSRLVGGTWTKPEIASFSGEWRDLEPSMSPDGSYMIFASNRPVTDGGKPLDAFYNGATQPARGGNLWRVDRTPTGWSTPRRLPDVVNSNTSMFSPSVVADGSLYFMQPTGAQTKFHIFRSQFSNGAFMTPVAVPVSSGENTGDFDPAVAPDESFMVFSSPRIAENGTSLFITFRRGGVWEPPTYMGPVTSVPLMGNIEARLSPDSRTLYFSSNRVVPTPPHDRTASAVGLERMETWNNGLANIWRVPLDRWLSKTTGQMTSPPPRVVGAGVISTPAEEFKATVSPDGRMLSYVVTDHLFRHMTIVQSERRGSEWSKPEVSSFSGIWRDGDPSFAPDGKTLLFISNRPMPGDSPGATRRDFNIWSVDRKPDGSWGDPAAVGRNINTDTSEFAPSVTSSGTLYFSRGDHMFRAPKRDDGFDAPVVLSISGGDPAISPDERFIVFDADGPTAGDADLFVSCRSATGWAAPIRLADPINSQQEEGDPSVSADGRTLYYFSRRFSPAPDRAPRAQRASYAAIQREALDNIFNGSRNLYEVELSPAMCEARGDSTAQVFAPGIVSTGHEFASTFTPDGKTILFTRSDSATRRAHIFASHLVDGQWQPAQALTISRDEYSDLDPSVSPDGQRLYFVSTRPREGTKAGTADMDIWYSDASGTGWGEPKWVAELSSSGKEGSPTVDRNGTLCFFSDRAGPAGSNAIFCSSRSTTGFAAPKRLNANVNAGPSDTSPFLAPDGRTLLFYSTRPGGAGQADMYASFLTGGEWGPAINLGPRVNTPAFEYNPVVSRDGSMMIFGRGRQMLYIDITALNVPELTASRFR
ncbi:MAG: hypothetical protein ABJE10_06010 [bacterium]